jgi:hypothetical protein
MQNPRKAAIPGKPVPIRPLKYWIPASEGMSFRDLAIGSAEYSM